MCLEVCKIILIGVDRLVQKTCEWFHILSRLNLFLAQFHELSSSICNCDGEIKKVLTQLECIPLKYANYERELSDAKNDTRG